MLKNFQSRKVVHIHRRNESHILLVTLFPVNALSYLKSKGVTALLRSPFCLRVRVCVCPSRMTVKTPGLKITTWRDPTIPYCLVFSNHQWHSGGSLRSRNGGGQEAVEKWTTFLKKDFEESKNTILRQCTFFYLSLLWPLSSQWSQSCDICNGERHITYDMPIFIVRQRTQSSCK
jgi:hypothetical protein